MTLTDAQLDRARGVLVGAACGDALGVPYEFKARLTEAAPAMIGGGLGPYAPGEWSDDTQMTCAIALALPDVDAVARGFVHWASEGASDIGNQTGSVLRHPRVAKEPVTAALLREIAPDDPERYSGNGALMRTSPLAVFDLLGEYDPVLVEDVVELTHPSYLCVESCVLWVDAIRRAVLTGEMRLDVSVLGLEAQAEWKTWISEAESVMPWEITNNGYTVAALQAAWSALCHSSSAEEAITLAVRAGNDTDTVASIAGALAGAVYGLSALPAGWVADVHGWPSLDAAGLVKLTDKLVYSTLDS